MSLTVIVHSASDLPNVDSKSLSDPFVVLSFRGCKKKTSVKQNTLGPKWEAKDATFEWILKAGKLQQDDKLSIEVRDYEAAWFKKLLGQVEIPLHELRKNGKEIKEQYYELKDGKHHPTKGKICLDIKFVPSGGGDRKIGEQIDGDEIDGDEDENQEDEDEHDHDKGEEKRSTKVKKRIPRTRVARKWSDKIKDFQIRIHIFEGRQLPGNDINPVVRVTVAGQRKQTSAEQSTNNPLYNDEMLSFNFHKSEAQLFDEPITLEVFNARGLFRSDALLGFFKLDIGFVHERKGHSFIRKWIMLSKPVGKKENESVNLGTKNSPAGYLKVTAIVQGSGDKLPPGIDAPPVEDKDEDIETNCLTPVGVKRQSAVFVLNVYQANDLPQMDAGVLTKLKKFFPLLSLLTKRSEEIPQAKEDFEEEQNLVDPYLIFSFGGNQVSTDIQYKNSNPKFKQVLKLPFLFPSMCQRLKLQLKDWDQGKKNDFIGTAYLHLSAISGQGELGEGFLPLFGPSYINFYGSPREYHKTLNDKLEHLNKGIGEGVAYRGRLLVELKTILGTAHGPSRDAMNNPDEIERFKKCSKFTLFACFHEATMIAVTDGSVEFEISMGNKGTKFDESVAPSNTTPCKPVNDHSHYHYLPWGGEKPCVWIQCSWEDISFRIEPFNILTNMWKKLEINLEELQKGDKEIKEVLEDFSKICKKELDRFRKETIKFEGRSQRNSLDKGIHNLRITELENLKTEAERLSKMKMETLIEEIKNYIKRIKSIAKEPQLSMPDVILWMISDNKRVAYCRVPAHHVLFSENESACGKFCGKTIELPLKFPGRDAQETHHEIPALVRLEL